MIGRWTAAAAVLIAAALSPASADAGLDICVWKNRLVLSFVPTLADTHARRQRDQRRYAPAKWSDRDLLLIEIGPGDRVTVDGRSDADLDAGHLRKSAPIRNGELFDVIDVMPMRHQEMRREATE